MRLIARKIVEIELRRRAFLPKRQFIGLIVNKGKTKKNELLDQCALRYKRKRVRFSSINYLMSLTEKTAKKRSKILTLEKIERERKLEVVKLIVGIVSSYRHYHHRQDCRTRWQWPVSSVSQPHQGEYDIAVQKLLKNTSRTPQHITPRAALWAKRFSLRNTRHHQSPPQHHPHTTTTFT